MKLLKLKSQWLPVKLFVLPLLVTLTACQTTTRSLETDSGPSFCSVAKAIWYSRHDTAPTRAQIREHNAVGQALKCGWLKSSGATLLK